MSSTFDLILNAISRGRALLGLPRAVEERGDLVELSEHLLSRRGEASGMALAQLVAEAYAMADSNQKLAFMTALVRRFGADRSKVSQAVADYVEDSSERNVQRLHEAAEPRRQELIRRINLAPGGTFALVKMREDLLRLLPNHPELGVADADFVHLFTSWFNRGFLELRPVDWETPGNILEKIIRYEAVHEIGGWDDLRRRLEPSDRRCFAFFHPRLPDEPLIFVEVALTSDTPAAIAPLLAVTRPIVDAKRATTAVFYSISNTQKGLSGVSFGSLLIKQVTEGLKAALPGLKTFVTLSPVPGFAAWLRAAECDSETKAALAPLAQAGWHENAAIRERVKPALMRAAAQYFLEAKNKSGFPVDPVARFHLGNGARLERLNFLGDPSPKGLEQSHGLMVNYVYAPDDIEKNHEAFASSGEIVVAASVRRLAGARVKA